MLTARNRTGGRDFLHSLFDEYMWIRTELSTLLILFFLRKAFVSFPLRFIRCNLNFLKENFALEQAMVAQRGVAV